MKIPYYFTKSDFNSCFFLQNYLSDCLRYLYTPEDNRECVNTIMENRSASPNVSLSTIGSTRPGPNFTSQADEQFSEVGYVL